MIHQILTGSASRSGADPSHRNVIYFQVILNRKKLKRCKINSQRNKNKSFPKLITTTLTTKNLQKAEKTFTKQLIKQKLETRKSKCTFAYETDGETK